MIAVLRPLVRGSTYRRAVFLLLGAVILLPYVLLAAVLVQMLTEPANRAAALLIAAVAAAIAAVPPFLGGTRELEIAAARALLQVDLPDGHGPLARETRLRSALWFGVHLAVGAVVGAALLIAVPMALLVLTERLGLSSGALAGLEVGPLGGDDLWAWTVVGVLLLIGTAYAVAGLGALAATMAPVLLGPSSAERLAALEARERRLAERNRLARELHDSVGHALTATTLQAGAARQVFDRDPDFARRALEAIEETGRAAMEDLDRVLGVLRADDDRLPHRSLDDLDRLIADIRRGGLDLSADVTVRPLPAGLSQESYRIVQEGLTNAAKYGNGSAALTLTVGPNVLIEITNAVGRTPGSRTGNGLAGMRERVRLIGGTLEAGPRDGVWRVSARIPVADR